ncbi:hypothetical protein OIDMADRAFT_141111 [Oidiodendron maius Zn]|uniref:FAD dependent oxidoreductase domain-containing protein n=1 Tax=Oidiodendron maius (strain Zn) TaxID=913774 RepID=A0A0C3I176_OIDMZ|nr:hypothetical protein OIDMADRAFT_141111 [Oidiodendron maius Zn]
MGIVLSWIRHLYKTILILFDTLSQLNNDFGPVLKRLNSDPGLPVRNPTSSYWLFDPPFPSLAECKSHHLPKEADVVIIGSGITGAAVAKTVLQEWARKGEDKKLVVLEAREICSGATGRNGGHIKVSPYLAFDLLEKKYGTHRAAEILDFQMRHLDVLMDLCEKESIQVAECRHVETVDVFLNSDVFNDKKQKIRQKFSFAPHVVGAISYRAGALFPYRFVTSVFRSLLDESPSAISIETNTPVTSICMHSPATHPYQVHTPRGIINARYIIHATNAYAGHLIPGLRGKMIGIRAHMSAQAAPQSFPQSDGKRSWSFVYGKADYDYMTQRHGKSGDLMLGGGFCCSMAKGLDHIAVYDDSVAEPLTSCHLRGMIPTVWGEDAEGGRVKNIWSGIICYTADSLPYVGRLDYRLTGRKVSGSSQDGKDQPAEWISAGYHGEGMVYAWLCGVAVGRMVVGSEDEDLDEQLGMPRGRVSEWLPKELLVTYKRVQNSDILDIAGEL